MESALPEGVRALDHTADVGLEIEAPSLEVLFDRAARGLITLIDDTEPHATHADEAALMYPVNGESIDVTLKADDTALLLADWLRELSFLRTTRGQVYRGARFAHLDDTRLEAIVAVARATTTPVREIKGVTYHGLEAKRTDSGWRARVIFDV